MGKRKDLTGQKFGKLTVIKLAGTEKRGRSLWLCQCECGNQKVIKAQHLLHNNTKSCGCSRHISHSGYSQRRRHSVLTEDDKRLENILCNMKARCRNPKNSKYINYGARGIKVCDEWQHVAEFRKWAYANGYKKGLTIERIDVNGNYEPSNCKWITPYEQYFNRTDNRRITYKGQTKTLKEWSVILNINYGTLKTRVNRWSVERAFTTPVINPRKK